MCQNSETTALQWKLYEFTRRTSQVRVVSQVRVTSRVKVRSPIVTRNINFPVVDIFHSRSKEPLPLRIAVASPRYTTTFNINTFSKNTKVYNLHMDEEHVPYT